MLNTGLIWWILFALGMTIFLRIFSVELKKLDLSRRQVTLFIVGLVVAIIAGERTLWVSRFWPNYAKQGWQEIVSFWHGGMDSSGGMLFALTFVIHYCQHYELSLRKLCDAGAIGAGWIIGIHRVGCFINGCDWGKATDSWLGVSFLPHQIAFQEQVQLGWIGADAARSLHVHPTQLYLSVLGLLIAIVFTFILRNKPWSAGKKVGLFLLAYGLGRFMIEFLRGDTSRGMIAGLSVPQWTMLILIMFGIGFLKTVPKSPDSEAHA